MAPRRFSRRRAGCRAFWPTSDGAGIGHAPRRACVAAGAARAIRHSGRRGCDGLAGATAVPALATAAHIAFGATNGLSGPARASATQRPYATPGVQQSVPAFAEYATSRASSGTHHRFSCLRASRARTAITRARGNDGARARLKDTELVAPFKNMRPPRTRHGNHSRRCIGKRNAGEISLPTARQPPGTRHQRHTTQQEREKQLWGGSNATRLPTVAACARKE